MYLHEIYSKEQIQTCCILDTCSSRCQYLIQLSWNMAHLAIVSSLLPINKDLHITPLLMGFCVMKFEILITVNTTGYTVLVLCSLIEMQQCIEETCNLHLQGERRQRKQVHPIFQYLCTRLHSITFQKTVIITLLLYLIIKDVYYHLQQMQTVTFSLRRQN